MVVVMMVVITMPGHHDNPWRIAAIRVMVVMMMVMVLRQLHIPLRGFGLALFIDRLQERCRVRDRFE
jgi:Na+/H+-dicarboxylate symporter